MRANVLVAVGVVGEPEDVQRFVEIMTADFDRRCRRAAEKLFAGRIEVMLPEIIDEEDSAEVH